ncbi:MAG: hypothetical protein ACI4I9_09715 [Porcipelethomonas sp.]
MISNYSALSYAKTVLNNDAADDNLKNLVKALYLYNRAAVGYNVKTGWVQDGENWYYLNDDGTLLRSAYTSEGYYVDENGIWTGI